MKCEWEKCKLGDVCNISSSKRIFAKEYTKAGIPFYRGKEIIEKSLGNNVSTELFISQKRYEEIKSKFDVPQKGDILLTSVGTLGVPWLVNEDDFYFKDGNLTWLRTKNELLNTFLYLWLNSSEAKHQIDTMCIGSTQRALTIDTLRKFEISVPSIQTQEKICSILYPIMDKIELNNAINNNLEQQAQALFKSWFVDFEPFGGMLPSNWKISQLNSIANISTEVFSPTKNPNVEVEHYSIPSYDENHYPVFENSNGIKSNKYRLTRNSVMISKLNPDTKRIWRPYCISNNPVCSTEFIVYEPINPLYRDFVYSIMDSIGFSAFLCSHTTGSTNSRQRATPSITLNYDITIPDEETLQTFCSIVSPMYDTIENNIKENQKLAETRDKLLQKLMSGELDVSGIDILNR